MMFDCLSVLMGFLKNIFKDFSFVKIDQWSRNLNMVLRYTAAIYVLKKVVVSCIDFFLQGHFKNFNMLSSQMIIMRFKMNVHQVGVI